ncbi:2-iminoacetate synthase ThiH [Campylobacter pinnipediorum]|uniref:2-iminoacetate synthase ThiH n=1 Tax=Campylobacter pinnipediorum TaxID=1965231 RepID=UPI00084E06B4|nr:2-iminoacetate synthase ThiH [Campylobacter pinnipediorum]AQW81451.1 ThiGH complex, tyrosine lyase subunit ThiH [Campylobacter pinnipediorum subsp. pinnipediorum]
MKFIDHMTYMQGMQQINSDILDRVLYYRDSYDYEKYTKNDVIEALSEDRLSIDGLMALLSPVARDFLEDMALKARSETRKYFGNSIEFFTPLYISNTCDSNCTYCGFASANKISRVKLKLQEAKEELENIAKSGLKDILILTGENSKKSDLAYIGEVCKEASKLFSNVGVEIYPLNSDEYAFLHSCGVDYVIVFQETYSTKRYSEVHIGGQKRVFPYRFNAQERALMGGMRSVGFAALLGLDDFRKDALSTALHAYFIQQKYPHAEIAISCPRLRPIINNSNINPKDVDEKNLFQVICAYRIFLPFSNITISTRESAKFRDGVVGVAASKISAGVSVGVGTHSDKAKKGDEQFEISDDRDVKTIYDDICSLGLQPVMSNHIYV